MKSCPGGRPDLGPRRRSICALQWAPLVEGGVEKETKKRCMLCGKESPKSICDLCRARVESEVLNRKKKEKEKTE